MSQVFMNCPNTGNPVYVGLNMEFNELESHELDTAEMTLEKCSLCGKDHVFRMADLFLRSDGGG